MATVQTIGRLLKVTLASYPTHKARLSESEIKDMATAWNELLADIPDELLGYALRAHIETSQWLPSIAEIRTQAAKLQRASGAANQTAIEAWGDVLEAFRTTGYYKTPVFANPITAQVIRAMGWRRMCEDDSPDGVLRAQFERYYTALMERSDRDATLSAPVHSYIEARRMEQLTAGVAAQLTARREPEAA